MEPLNGLNNGKRFWQKPEPRFFLDDDVVQVARRLLGMKLISFIDGNLTSGLIIETEAYAGEYDLASHASGGRRTKRTETMYGRGGVAYIYLCYGLHSLFNVVTNQQGVPHAVLVRAIMPFEGTEIMESRIGRRLKPNGSDGTGPGKVTRLLGIDYRLNGTDLTESRSLWIESCGLTFENDLVKVMPRVGVDYAGSDALLPYRFIVTHYAAANAIKKAITL